MKSEFPEFKLNCASSEKVTDAKFIITGMIINFNKRCIDQFRVLLVIV